MFLKNIGTNLLEGFGTLSAFLMAPLKSHPKFWLAVLRFGFMIVIMACSPFPKQL